MRHLAIMILLLVLALTISAQDTTLTTYNWDAAGISLDYPANWDEPLPVEAVSQVGLQMAQVLVDTPAEVRPPAIPIINLTVFANSEPADGNLLPFLFPALQTLGIDRFDQPTTATFLESPAAQLTGASADSQFFGIGRVALLGTDVVVIAGRAISANQEDFLATFAAIANSVRASVSIASGSDYGVLWHTQRSLDDGDEALVELVGLAYGPADTLYTYERVLGLVQLDASTGTILNISPNENITNPTAVAVASDNTAYVADADCGCIFTLTPDNIWLDQQMVEENADTNTGLIVGFGPDSPQQMTIGAGDVLYATNIATDGTISIRSFQDGQQRADIQLASSQVGQPLLSIDANGQVMVLTQIGELFSLHEESLTELSNLGPVSEQIKALALTPTDDLAIATSDQGILIITQAGNFVAQPGNVVPTAPLPGEMVAPAGIALDPQGTLYFVDSDGSFGALTAFSTRVAADRLGSTKLLAGQAVQGSISSEMPQQAWTYAGTAGERITITALDNTGIDLDLALRLLAPDGTEAAFNDNHDSLDVINSTDSQIINQMLSTTGDYTIVVEQVEGEGTYTLGVGQTRSITLDASTVTTLTGRLQPVFPADILEFGGTNGQVLTLTMETVNGDLDPLLYLIGPDGIEVGFNDDADDPALGSDAQIVNIMLPLDGLYRLDAARFDGSGNYRLTIEVLS